MKTKYIIGIGTLFLILAITFVHFQQKKEYIGGNVLHLPYAGIVHDERIVSPWKNSGIIVSLLYRTLFLAESDSVNYTNDLASNCQILDDGLTYKITLKENQKWSDGETITIDDIIFSIESSVIARETNPIFVTAFNKINEMTSDGNVLTISLSEKHANFVSILAQLVILPKHILKNENMVNFIDNIYWKNPIVSGMYKLVEPISGKTFELTRNQLYGGQKPKIDKVIFYIDYVNANLDYFVTNNIAEMVDFRAMRGFKEFDASTLFYRYFVFNMEGIDGFTNPAMQDIRIRQAIAHAIDRDALLSNVYFKAGNLKDSSALDIPESYDYNPEKAVQLLEEAQYDFERPLRLIYYYTDATSTYFMQQVIKYLEAVGFKTVLKNVTNPHKDLYVDRQYDVMLKGLAALDSSVWYLEYASSHPQLVNLFGNKGEFDELLDELVTEMSPEKNQQILSNLKQLGFEKFYKFPLFTLNQTVYINTNRLKIPDGIVFGSQRYNFNIQFQKWEIIKK